MGPVETPSQTPFSPFFRGVPPAPPRPALAETAWALGAVTRKRANPSELTCGYSWKGWFSDDGFQSSFVGVDVTGAGALPRPCAETTWLAARTAQHTNAV